MLRAELQPAAPVETRVRSLHPDEQGRVLAWLDRGLRDGRPGRLAAEYGAALDAPEDLHHVVATEDDVLVAHALARRVIVHAGGCAIPVGLIGLVYTEPSHRRRGLAARCIRACEDWLTAEGVGLSLLWSDRHAWYERLGYHLSGAEHMHALDSTVCERATRATPFEGEVGAPKPDDWPALEGLHALHPARAERRQGFLASLAAGPDCELRVARRGGHPLAYAALGRGDDFEGVVHEWAGELDGVMACLTRLREGRDAIHCMSGPGDDRLASALSQAGAPSYRGGFALAHLLDPAPLWRELVARDSELFDTSLESSGTGFRLTGADGTCDLDGQAAVRLILDSKGVDDFRSVFSEAQLRALSARLPWPLFVWGFDSI